MDTHDKLTQEADELFESLKKADRERMVFRWSYTGNRELGDVLRRLWRVETLLYSILVAGILGLIVAKILGG